VYKYIILLGFNMYTYVHVYFLIFICLHLFFFTLEEGLETFNLVLLWVVNFVYTVSIFLSFLGF